jgi:hypothetical protein
MGRKQTVVLVAGVLAAGGAAVGLVLATGGGGGTPRADTDRLRADIARQLPAGWTDTVDTEDGKVNIRLTHEGDEKAAILSMRKYALVNPDSPAMMRLLPAGTSADSGTEYVFHLTDSKDRRTMLRAAAGKGHRSGHPELQFMSKEFMSAEFALLPPPSPVIIP